MFFFRWILLGTEGIEFVWLSLKIRFFFYLLLFSSLLVLFSFSFPSLVFSCLVFVCSFFSSGIPFFFLPSSLFSLFPLFFLLSSRLRRWSFYNTSRLPTYFSLTKPNQLKPFERQPLAMTSIWFVTVATLLACCFSAPARSQRSIVMVTATTGAGALTFFYEHRLVYFYRHVVKILLNWRLSTLRNWFFFFLFFFLKGRYLTSSIRECRKDRMWSSRSRLRRSTLTSTSLDGRTFALSDQWISSSEVEV